jgi:hypothetical protein
VTSRSHTCPRLPTGKGDPAVLAMLRSEKIIGARESKYTREEDSRATILLLEATGRRAVSAV